MKIHIINSLLSACVALTGAYILSSCTPMLQEVHETSYTTSYVTSDADGLKLMTAALYPYERNTFATGYANNELMNLLNRYGDIVCCATGSGEQVGLYNPSQFKPSQTMIKGMWSYLYGVIGRCNEIISAAESLETMDDDLKRCVGEAKLFRAKMIFNAYRLWHNILLNTTVVDYTNVDGGIEYRPATEDEVYAQLYKDVNDGIDALDWLSYQPGRWNKAAGLHLKAKVAMEQGDYKLALECIDAIENSHQYALIDNVHDVFLKSDNLNHSEGLLVQQWSMEVGGNLNNTTPQGSNFNRWYTTQYRNLMGGADDVCSYENGCKGAGCILANYYLLSLYDHEKDKRYTDWFILKIKNTTDHDVTVEGVVTHPGEYFQSEMNGKDQKLQVQPGSRKYLDVWNVLPYEANNYKDMLIYRLAESYIIGAEAALREGDMAKARFYYNKTWTRAGNDEITGDITLDDIIDEQARELCFEQGERYFFLKRLGIYQERYIAHAGEEGVRSSTDGRNNLQNNPHFLTWPIPETEILAMGAENFPQNPGY